MRMERAQETGALHSWIIEKRMAAAKIASAKRLLLIDPLSHILCRGKDVPQGLKPALRLIANGTAEAVPFPNRAAKNP